MNLRTKRRDLLAWVLAAVMAGALLVWTAFHVMGSTGGIGFSLLLLLTLMVLFYVAWRGCGCRASSAGLEGACCEG